MPIQWSALPYTFESSLSRGISLHDSSSPVLVVGKKAWLSFSKKYHHHCRDNREAVGPRDKIVHDKHRFREYYLMEERNKELS
jgi:hypothetical protein